VTLTLPKIAPLTVKPRAAAFDNRDGLFELKYDDLHTLIEIDDDGAPRLAQLQDGRR
jgi:hypothetical protein